MKEGVPRRKVSLLQTCTVLALLGILYCTFVLHRAKASRGIEVYPPISTSRGIEVWPSISTSKGFELQPSISTIRGRLLVLLWTPFFGTSDWMRGCGLCDVTSDRALLPRARALVLHWRDLDDPPPPTAPLVVLFNHEAPPHTPAASLRNLTVHWTATYRRDSDIYAPYGEIVERTEPYQEPALPANRSLVCWLVSNCNTPGGREAYVKQLERYVDVQVYGKCGTRKCPHAKASDCYKWLSERCQFYLSFENSLCRDYATEKLYLALTTDMVPVVLGGETRHLPADAVVDATRFASPQSLAQHLRTLAADDAAYRRHLAWKRRWEARPLEGDEWLCTLCDRLYHYNQPPPPRTDLQEWWFDGGHCRNEPFLGGSTASKEEPS